MGSPLESFRRFFDRFAVKLIGMLLVVLGALLLLSLHLNSQTRRDTHAAFYQRSNQLVRRLQRLGRTLRKTVSVKRETYAATAREMAQSPELTYSVLEGDARSVYDALTRLLNRHFSVRHLEVRDQDERLIAQCGELEQEAAGRMLFVVEPLRIGGGWLIVRFAIPKQLREIKQAIGDELKWEEFQRVFDNVLVKFEYTGWFTGRFAAGMLFVLIIALFFARSLTRRLARLAGATRSVAAGDLNVVVETRSRDEIAELSHAFNDMVGELRRSQAQIVYLQKISAWQEIARRLAHEIKNPLTPILLATQEVREKYAGEDEGYRKLLDTSTEIVQEEIGELRRLVEEFSAFAKLPSVTPQATSVAALFEDCRRGLGDLEAKVSVSWDPDEGETSVQVDTALFKRVVYNLVENALQATAQTDAAPQVVVRARTLADRRFARIEITDNGPGGSEELRERIFDPYFTTKRNGQGLGLAICKKILLEHRGNIEVENAPTGGARFTLTLPLT